jgi:hypothetical protein
MGEDFLRNCVIAERKWNDWCCQQSAIDPNTTNASFLKQKERSWGEARI